MTSRTANREWELIDSTPLACGGGGGSFVWEAGK